MALSLEIALMKNIETHNFGDPYKVIDNIDYAKAQGIDIIAGPEWSLTHELNVLPYDKFKLKDTGETLDALFEVSKDFKYAPKDAKVILERQLYEGNLDFKTTLYPLRKFKEKFNVSHQELTKYKILNLNGGEFIKVIKVPKVPYSEREYTRLVSTIKKHSVGSDILIIPGTAMYYTGSLKLYNAAPVIQNGKVINSFYKVRDGGGSKFNLNGALELVSFVGSKSFSKGYGEDPTLYFNGLKLGVEICADTGMLKYAYGINDLDLQLLISCGMKFSVSATKHQGYKSIVDGYKRVYTSVMRDNSKKLEPEHEGSYIDIFRLEY
ncbi:MAG: hypothetical protein ACP5RE_00220 [Candidatus Acidifodinimicrobium sp.]